MDLARAKFLEGMITIKALKLKTKVLNLLK